MDGLMGKMDGWIGNGHDGWMDCWMGHDMEEWMDGWIDDAGGQMDGWIAGWMGQMDGWIAGWIGQMDGWIAGWIGQMDGSYALEPVSPSSNHEHFLFPMEKSETEPFVCGVDSKQQHDSSRVRTSPMDVFFRKKRNLPQTRYVELVLVVDHLRFKIKKSDRVAVREEMVQLANFLDTYFRQLNIRIVLVGLEIFETGNPFDVEGSASEVLGRFVEWRKKNLTSRVRNDMAQLVIGRTDAYSGGILGMAYVGTVCSAGSGGGISVLSELGEEDEVKEEEEVNVRGGREEFSDERLQFYSTVMAHEMGHNLGMNHDTSSCQCDGNSCIMNSGVTSVSLTRTHTHTHTHTHTPLNFSLCVCVCVCVCVCGVYMYRGSRSFSSCSAQDFEALVLRGGGVCLLNQPAQNSVISGPKCGNQILEGSEECDCGPPELLVSGTPCRASANQCDLPEFCTGQSGFCPPDSYQMDGLTCESGTAYCFEGRCQTLEYQCRQLFGQTATRANEKCFSHVNTQGTRFGNCGYSGSQLVPCSVANSKCGKIQCTNFDSNYPPPGAVLSVENIEPGVSCRNADFNLGSDVLDPGYVKTGTVCAANKVNKRWDGMDYSLRNGLLIFFLLVLPVLLLVVFGLLYVFRRDSLNRCFRCRRSKRSR
ncbi:Disintegrin and metalloproteinase domain-containing protein 9 [Bagarius yarrelli]|uniref:Disintegrin and metalloproteinase domain-containing protein 9 n=1 Tax=Bagarius yarrelli TaxID=175774 RepID=A0A556VWB9_BAGYA|nr:Disintegrin and metalloproteinase domain-containing protein 9 [Bagarius yarrelli]